MRAVAVLTISYGFFCASVVGTPTITAEQKPSTPERRIEDSIKNEMRVVAMPVMPASNQNILADPVRAMTAPSIKTTTFDPPAHLRTVLQAVWKSYTWEKTYKNWAFHQIYANKGELNFCVAWNSEKTSLSAADRKLMAKNMEEMVQRWIDVLNGYDGWKYPKVTTRVTRWVAKNKQLLPNFSAAEGVLDSGSDQAPTGGRGKGPSCNRACYRYLHKNGVYSGCPGGAKNHFDMVITLADGMRGGAGQDWGQVVGTEMFLREMRSPKQDRLHIWLHELGHGFGLDDFYTPKNYNNGRLATRAGNQTRFIMKAGSAVMITEFDAWMARNMWSCHRPQMEGKGLPAFCK